MYKITGQLDGQKVCLAVLLDRELDRQTVLLDIQTDRQTESLTGQGSVEGEGAQAGELVAAGLLHAVAEGVLPGVQLQQLNALQDLRGLLQTVRRVVLRRGKVFHDLSKVPCFLWSPPCFWP